MRASFIRRLFVYCLIALWAAGNTSTALAQRAGFVAPPRTIADITAILDQEKPDPAKRAKEEADADAEPPAHANSAKLRDFYFNRAQARSSLGRLAEAIADCERAAANASEYVHDGSVIETYQEFLMRANAEHREAIAVGV
jgi:hypothetical protein